jgi:hypothetical protein
MVLWYQKEEKATMRIWPSVVFLLGSLPCAVCPAGDPALNVVHRPANDRSGAVFTVNAGHPNVWINTIYDLERGKHDKEKGAEWEAALRTYLHVSGGVSVNHD